MERLIKMFSVMMMILVLSSVVHGQRNQKETLKGLKNLVVMATPLISDITITGLNHEQIQTDIELKFRMAGIKIVEWSDAQNYPGHPYLFVIIESTLSKNGQFFVFTVDVELWESVILIRDKKIMCTAVTWRDSKYGTATLISAKTFIRDIVKDKVDKFINDYLEMNPKE